MDCVYISEGSYLWKHNDAVIYLRGICHEEDSIIFKVLSINANAFSAIYDLASGT